jgi:ABC-2 type transport system ATP-binding protein
MPEAAIEAIGVRKRYGKVPVLDGLDLCVFSGEVFCLLGPNGPGKSTLIHLLLGFIRLDAGQIRVLGQEPGRACRVGYVPEHVRYHGHFAPREYLRYLGHSADLRGHPLEARIDDVLAMVNLERVADRRLGTFSKGMLQRLGLAQALLPEPDILLVDEPTSGLDPAGQREVLDILLTLRRRGHTILACTRQLSEVELLADRVGVLWSGKLAALARVADLPPTSGVVVKIGSPGLGAADASQLADHGMTVSESGSEITIRGDRQLQRFALQRVLDAGLTVAELRPVRAGVEALYLDAIGARVADDGRLIGAGTEVGS